MKTIYPKSIEELREHIKRQEPSIYVSSRTSTVIPFDKIEKQLDQEKFIVDLSTLPKSIELEGEHLVVTGPVTWAELKQFAQSKGKRVLTSPTDQSACVLAGLATSCTGEISFAYGTLRDQVQSLSYLNYEGDEKILSRKTINISSEYSAKQEEYHSFKNAPFPKFYHEVDLLIGTEGQLGVITKCALDCVDQFNDMFLLLPLNKWEEDDSKHLEILDKVQSFRQKILSCELLDSNSLKFAETAPVHNGDFIVLQVHEDYLEDVYQNLLTTLGLDLDEVLELAPKQFHELRVSIPRQVNEHNSRKGIVKRGTDVQVRVEQLKELLEVYRGFSKLGVAYNLFGHFGDCHLHFNFLPLEQQSKTVDSALKDLYAKVLSMKCSPFAEHGIGLIKQGYAQQYWDSEIKSFLRSLKDEHDPKRIFYPSGYMRGA